MALAADRERHATAQLALAMAGGLVRSKQLDVVVDFEQIGEEKPLGLVVLPANVNVNVYISSPGIPGGSPLDHHAVASGFVADCVPGLDLVRAGKGHGCHSLRRTL